MRAEQVFEQNNYLISCSCRKGPSIIFIHMQFRILKPSADLQPFVQCYLEADSSATFERGEHTLFPNGLSGIFFNFGTMGRLIINENYKTPKVSVFGQIDRHFTVVHWPGFYSLGVLFKPTVLSWLLRIEMSELTNKAFDGQLIRSDLSDLYSGLEGESQVERKVHLIERYLRNVLSCQLKKPDLVDHAIEMIHHQQVVSVEEVAKKLHVSQRYLEKQFKTSIGLSPKTYSLIQRFRRMEFELRRMSTVHWPGMSFANEYYDQNHFIKDFKRFTGLTPSDYLNSNLEMGRSYLTTH